MRLSFVVELAFVAVLTLVVELAFVVQFLFAGRPYSAPASGASA